MLRRALTLLVIVLAFLLPVEVLHPQERAGGQASCTLMLDESKSMEGFYRADLASFTGLVAALSVPCGDGWVAGLVGQPYQGRLSDHRPISHQTNLGSAFERWLRQSQSNRLVLVTDNVADSSAAARQDEQELLYRNLRAPESQLTHISMIILRPPFDGTVYALNNRVSRHYPGPRALTIYVIERRGRHGDEAFLNQVETIVRGRGYRPYGGRGAPGARDYAVARLSPFRPGLTADQSGMSVSALDGGRGVSVRDGAIHVVRGASDQETRFAVRSLQVATGPDWDLGDAPFSARVEFPESPIFGPALQGRCEVNPPRSHAGLNQRLNLSLTCAIPAAADRLTVEQRDSLVRQGSQVREGSLVLAIETRGRDLSLRGPLQHYFGMSPRAASGPDGLASVLPDVQARVYRLPELLANTIPPADRTVVVKRFDLKVEMGISALDWLGRALLAWAPLIVALLILGLIGWLLSWPVTYRISGAEAVDRLKLSFASTQQVRAIGGARVDLTLLGPIILANTGGRRRILRRSGGAVLDSSNRRLLSLERLATARSGPGAGPLRRPMKRGPSRR